MANNNWNTTVRRPNMDSDRLNAKLDAVDASIKKQLALKAEKNRQLIEGVKKTLSTKVSAEHLAILEAALERLKQGDNMTPQQAGVFGIYKSSTQSLPAKKRRHRKKSKKARSSK